MEAPALVLSAILPAPPLEPVERAPDPGPGDASTAPSARVPPPSWTAWLVAPRADLSLRAEAVRGAVGLGLAALYGVALGARAGGGALAVHAVGVPAALLCAFGLGTPALYIALAIFDAPLEPQAAAAATARGVATTGLVLAGFAPAAALFVVSSERPGAAALAAGAGLGAGLALGLGRLFAELGKALAPAPLATRSVAIAAFAGFLAFAVAVFVRVSGSLLPLLGGGR